MLTKKSNSANEGSTFSEKKTEATAANPQAYRPSTNVQSSNTTQTPKSSLSKITIKCNCGYGNNIFLRGEGGGLSWEKGVLLKNIDADTWVWETDRPFNHCQFKISLNDTQYEKGENHQLKHGSHVSITPNF